MFINYLFYKAEPDEAMLAKMLESMAFGAGGSGMAEGLTGDVGNLGDIFPAMHGMLQSLLSKELLYPSIKEIVNKVCTLLFHIFNIYGPDWISFLVSGLARR